MQMCSIHQGSITHCNEKLSHNVHNKNEHTYCSYTCYISICSGEYKYLQFMKGYHNKNHSGLSSILI